MRRMRSRRRLRRPRRMARRSRAFRKRKIYRTARRKLAFTTIRDRTVIKLTTDASGTCLIGANLNAAPSGKSTDFFAFGNPTSLAAQKFPKFDWIDKLWEQCRCRWIKWKWYPLQPFDNSTTSSAGYVPCYFVQERDGIDFGVTTSIPTSTDILNEPNMKVINRQRPFTIFQRCTKYGPYNKVPAPKSTALQETGQNIWGQWHGINTSIGDLDLANSAHQYFVFFGAKPSSDIGYFQIEASFDLKGQVRVEPTP